MTISVETFTTVVVPGIASVAYASAGIACFFAHRPALAVMWLCYAIANICLLSTVLRK
jgi:hypothetical protein